MSPQDLQILKLYADLPPNAVVPVTVAKVLKGCSELTIRRHYKDKMVRVSDRRVGIRKSELEKPTNAAA